MVAVMEFEDMEAPATGRSSLDLLQAIYRCPDQPLSVRMKAAIAALEHPKLAVTAVVDGTEDLGARLSRAIQRSAKVIELRAIEGAVAPTGNGQAANDHTTASVVSTAAMRRPMAVTRRR
jgi:hypothetical protein